MSNITVPQVVSRQQDQEKLRDHAIRALVNLTSKSRRERAWARQVLADLIRVGVVEYYLDHRRVGLLVFRSSDLSVIEIGGVQ